MKKFLLICLIVAGQSGACHALQLNFVHNKFAEFAFDLYYSSVRKNPDKVLLDNLANFDTEEIGFLERASEEYMLLFPRSPYMVADRFFCKLAQLNTIDDIDQVLCEIKDQAQRGRLREKINTSYTTWEEKGRAKQSLPRIRSHVQMLQYVANKNKNLIDEWVNRILAFYGTQSIPSELIVYICPEANISTYCNNTLFLEGSSFERSPERVLGVVLHEVAHMAYEYQKRSLKKTIDHFFLHFPSQHAYITYNYLDEALATALGNGILVEELIGTPDMRYNNQYIQGLAEDIYGEVKNYLNKNKEIDQKFLVKAVKHFEKRFPQLTNDLTEILDRYVLFVDNVLNIEGVYHVFQQYFAPFTVFEDTLSDPKINENVQYYDSNAPLIFVLHPKKRDQLTELRNANPYLNRVNKSKLKKLKGNFDFHRDKHGRLYLFFIVTNTKELETLVKELSQQRYL
jgi:hypothetical protein